MTPKCLEHMTPTSAICCTSLRKYTELSLGEARIGNICTAVGSMGFSFFNTIWIASKHWIGWRRASRRRVCQSVQLACDTIHTISPNYAANHGLVYQMTLLTKQPVRELSGHCLHRIKGIVPRVITPGYR